MGAVSVAYCWRWVRYAELQSYIDKHNGRLVKGKKTYKPCLAPPTVAHIPNGPMLGVCDIVVLQN